MFKIIKIAIQLRKNPKLNLSLFFIFTAIATTLEIFSIGVILPLIQSIISGDQNFVFVFKGIKYFEMQIQSIFLIFLFLFITKNIYLIFYYWWISKFTWTTYSGSSNYLLKRYLSNNFVFFKKNSISELVQNCYIETRNFTGAFSSALIIIFESLVLVSIILFLLSIQFKMTLFAMVTISILMFSYQKLFSKILEKWGSQRKKFSIKTLKSLNEIFGGIKTIKIFNVEKIFSNIFMGNVNSFSSISAKHNAFTNYPKIVLETIVIIIISVSLIFLNYYSIEMKSMIPFFGVFAAATFRLLPSINKLMLHFNNISFYQKSIDMMVNEYNKSSYRIENTTSKNISFKNEIRIKDLNFSHNQKDIIYEQENLTIKKFDCIGIYGESGSGKTTLVDIIIGLYSPNKGELIIDNNKIVSEEDIQSWQKKVSYVPQSIFLFNGSIKNNVSFEFNENLIDNEKVSQSLLSSQLEKFANKSEKMNYEIDEGGGNLSIGEKQRVGIARALYKDPELIILDEPTSALDRNTANNLIKFLREFKKKRTLIIISHDLNSLQFCDKIYKISKTANKSSKIILKDSLG